jgi:phenylalanyl-tRNA synthetase beta chain
MKISLNWLQDYIETELNHNEIADILTSTGLEVEGVEEFQSLSGGLYQFFIGEIVACTKHPNADKLSLTEVNLGERIGKRKIVCGAPNVAFGQKVVVALEGAKIVIPGKEPFEIKNAKIRGEESQGMICAEDEIGVGISHDGILVLPNDATVGMKAADYFEIYQDIVFEIGLTPNRTDAMSHQGVARDLAAALTARKIPHKYKSEGLKKFDQPKSSISNPYSVEIKSENANVFNTALIQDIKNTDSPKWMSYRLKAIGESPKNLFVDITNYISHDLGQPMHAYDADKVIGKTIQVKDVSESFEFEALNNQKYKLELGDLAISDSNGIIGLAGVMGGLNSAVSETTSNIILEAAYFEGQAVRKTAMRLSLRSESAVKFEKGIDPTSAKNAMQKAIEILASIDSKSQFSEIKTITTAEFPAFEVTLRSSRLNLYGNQIFEPSQVEQILKSLGIQVKSFVGEVWTLSVPRFKEDVRREDDIIEEILRIYGLNQIPYPKYLRSSLSHKLIMSRNEFETKISNFLVGNNYSEVMTNSISQSKYYDSDRIVKLTNSMTSELDCMRMDLHSGMLEITEYNVNRDQRNLNVFELGHIYCRKDNGKYKQQKQLCIMSTGFQSDSNWREPNGIKNDYFQIKKIVENLFESLDLNLGFDENRSPDYDFGLSILVNNKPIGNLGQLKIKKDCFHIKQEVFIALLDVDTLYDIAISQKLRYKEVSKFPSVRRDLALLIDETIQFEQIKIVSKKALGNSLVKIDLFDIYRGEKLGVNKKSYAVRFTLLDTEKTMSDKDIDNLMDKVIRQLNQVLNAEIRA